MEKKLYWLLESNGDLSMTIPNDSETVMVMIQSDFETLENNEAQEETQYTITPVWYTDEEYKNLPEAD